MKLRIFIWVMCSLACLQFTGLQAQVVTISDEVNIRLDYSYEILGDIDGHTLLYREQKGTRNLTAFDEKFEFVYERDINLEESNIDVHGLIPFDTSFQMIYTFADDSLRTMVRTFDKAGVASDTILLFTREKSTRSPKMRFVFSQDKSKSVLYSYSFKGGLHFYVLDNIKKQLLAFREIKNENRSDFEDFEDLTISNTGEVFLLYQSNNKRFTKKDHQAYMINLDPYSGEYVEERIPLADFITVDMETKMDNVNGVYNVVGLFSEKESQHAQGFFFFTSKGTKQVDPARVAVKYFDESFLQSVFKESKKDKLDYHKIKSLQLTHDGTMVLITEYDKVFSRRPSFQGGIGTRSRGINSATWQDHYVEEVLVMAIEPTGKIRWNNLLHKKQFSQDDNAIFSSFFLFSLPSRLMVIFNDDVRRNNIVSEFSISPSGKLDRSSLLSTEYQNLKLRFTGAVQSSSNSFIVPSERSNVLRLVKVTYE